MTEQDMESYMNCSKLSYHPLLTMENELLQVEGSAQLINISAEERNESHLSSDVLWHLGDKEQDIQKLAGQDGDEDRAGYSIGSSPVDLARRHM
ncbi:hypothetical protein Pcinc_008793 [Petrolisthes cinctipes]|uniref:Uncharacterized protein n=1 Tax=Petrolisthes cinctipes TaxID=88211 RepID=A0AAE1G820_PETCI|nr:hypothetical protein Pcinc_009106 [Petrolisthes cinctipes]KAK3887106.1 hypothetical protein Pcinc_008793 [Petrolisthes cinctipes]